jgi:thiosulfate/3-mercaptopyruvate sulfurtransferase
MLSLPGPIVSVDWLAAHTDDAALRIADVRWALNGPPGRERYEEGHLVGTDEVMAMSGAGAILLDARAGERYRGETEPIDPRAGHVPGAHTAPWAANLDGDGRFLPPAELRARYARLAAGTRPTVAYCGSSLTATHDLLALELAGIEGGLLYEGAWSHWSSDPARPVAIGPTP